MRVCAGTAACLAGDYTGHAHLDTVPNVELCARVAQKLITVALTGYLLLALLPTH